MSTASDSEPDPAFLDHLEWQLRTQLRREARFAPREVAPVWTRRLKTAALVAASLALGGATVVAAERVQQSREAQILAQQTRVRIDLQRSRAELAQQRLAQATERVQVGIATQSEAEQAELARTLEQIRLRRLELELSEVELSGREPRDALDSALVAGMDFVTRRLELDRQTSHAQLEALTRAREWLEKMAAAGFVSGTEVERNRCEALEPESQVRAIDQLLELRRAYLLGTLQRERVWVLAERARSAAALESLRGRIEFARAQLQRTEALSNAGVASSEELDRSRQELLQLEGESRLLGLELERLDARLRD
jgi:hypothetical protein